MKRQKRKLKVFPSRLSHTLYVHTIFYASLDFSFFFLPLKKIVHICEVMMVVVIVLP